LEPPPTHIILSVGGNDVREILRDMGRLPEVIIEFTPRYIDIVNVCMTVTRNVVLMFQYRPSFYMDHGGYGVYQAIGSTPGPGEAVQKMNMLMQTIYTPILGFAQEQKLPIIDLPRTFDIWCDELYSHQIEPSAKGGAVIAAIVDHVITNDSADKPSTLYSYAPCVPGAGTISELPNAGVPWLIPHDPSRVPVAGTDGPLSKIMALVGMGFERSQVEAALERNGGDQGRAVAELLSETSH
jgi:hypothetical protein